MRYLAKRLTWGFFTLWAISVLAFIVMQLPPGDYASSYVARLEQSGVSPLTIEQARHHFGLDQPAYVQYLHWISGILHGDFGMSLLQSRPVSQIITGQFLYTALVAAMAVVCTWLVALPLGIYSAVHRYSVADYAVTCLSFIGVAVPAFLFALALLYLAFNWFGVSLGGLFSPEYQTAPWSWGKLVNLLEHLIIPAIVLSATGMASLLRIMRANLLDELSKPYVVTAQAKGLSRWRIILKYPVRVALNPFASSIGLFMREVVGDTIIVSVVLSLPTLGPTLLDALQAQDMLLAGAIILLLGLATIIGTLISDILLMILDPRIRHAG